MVRTRERERERERESGSVLVNMNLGYDSIIIVMVCLVTWIDVSDVWECAGPPKKATKGWAVDTEATPAENQFEQEQQSKKKMRDRSGVLESGSQSSESKQTRLDVSSMGGYEQGASAARSGATQTRGNDNGNDDDADGPVIPDLDKQAEEGSSGREL